MSIPTILIKSCTAVNYQRQFGEYNVHLTLKSVIHNPEKLHHKLKAGTWGRIWKSNHGGMLLTGLLLHACSFHFLIHIRAICTETTSVQWPAQFHITHQPKSCLRLAFRSIWWELFLTWGCLFSENYSLYQTDRHLSANQLINMK